MESLMNASISSKENDGKGTILSGGLVPDHAYSVLQAVEVETSQADKLRLIKLRNPHGTEDSWTGLKSMNIENLYENSN